jgi:hypothetical protein
MTPDHERSLTHDVYKLTHDVYNWLKHDILALAMLLLLVGLGLLITVTASQRQLDYQHLMQLATQRDVHDEITHVRTLIQNVDRRVDRNQAAVEALKAEVPLLVRETAGDPAKGEHAQTRN